jgi:hypothetical protein
MAATMSEQLSCTQAVGGGVVIVVVVVEKKWKG